MLRAVVRPSIASIEGVQVLDITVEPFLRELATILLQAQVCKYSEPKPICVGHAAADISSDPPHVVK